MVAPSPSSSRRLVAPAHLVRLTLLVLLGLVPPCVHAQGCTVHDTWRGQDKVKHVLVGAAIGSAGTMLFDRPAAGVALGAGAGLARELFDLAHPPSTCSFQDFAATALGAALGAYGTAWVVLPRRHSLAVGYSRRF